MLTRRDVIVALLAAGTTCGLFAAAKPGLIGSSVYDWNAMKVTKTNVGEVRQVFKGPTATLDELEMHVTTLNPGEASHPPHHHPNEELIILRQGTIETLSKGKWVRVGPGSVILNGSNDEHGLRNVGTDQAIYHVVNWKTATTPAQ